MSNFVPVIHASHGDRPDEADTLVAAEAVAEALARLGCRSEIVALDLDFSLLETLAGQHPWVVFNLVEAVRGDASLAHLAPALLTHLNLPFTGAGLAAQLRTLSKLITKETLVASGLPTPPWWTAGEDVPGEAQVIVKAVWEHASYGMDSGSVVPGSRAAAEIASRQARFGGKFFAERYLPGREFNVALLAGPDGPEVLPVQEILFEQTDRPRIVDYEAKWDPASAACLGTPRRFGLEQREPALADRAAALAQSCWEALGLSGYARVDLRTDAAGELSILEVNVNPCLTPDAGFVATAQAAGLDYDAIIARILTAADNRRRSPQPCCA